MINWKMILGILLIFGSLKEIGSIIIDFRSGKLAYWPFGVEIAGLAVVILGVYLFRKGQKDRKRF